MRARHPDELLADFQQFYQMNLNDFRDALDGDETTDEVLRLAALCAQLPRGSRTMRAASPALEWTDEAYLLARVEHAVRHLAWMLSEDGAKGANRPRPLPTPAQVSADTARAESTDFQLIDSVLPYGRG